MKSINERAKEYAKNESDYYKRLICEPLNEFETQLVTSTYKRAWLDAIRQAELMYIYGTTGYLERLKELKR